MPSTATAKLQHLPGCLALEWMLGHWPPALTHISPSAFDPCRRTCLLQQGVFTTLAGVLSRRWTLIALFSRVPVAWHFHWAILTIRILIECSVGPYNVFSLLCSTKVLVSVTLKDNTNTFHLATWWLARTSYSCLMLDYVHTITPQMIIKVQLNLHTYSYTKLIKATPQLIICWSISLENWLAPITDVGQHNRWQKIKTISWVEVWRMMVVWSGDIHTRSFVKWNNELFVFLISCCAGQRRL